MLVNDGFALVNAWLHRFQGNDWTPADVRGLIPLLAGREVFAVGRGDVTVIGADGLRVKIFRRPSLNGLARWDEGRRAA